MLPNVTSNNFILFKRFLYTNLKYQIANSQWELPKQLFQKLWKRLEGCDCDLNSSRLLKFLKSAICFNPIKRYLNFLCKSYPNFKELIFLKMLILLSSLKEKICYFQYLRNVIVFFFSNHKHLVSKMMK
jgi:hypothetical protein